MKSSNQNFSLPVQLTGWLAMLLIALACIAIVVEIAARIFLPNINVLLNIIAPTDDARHFVLKPNASTIYRGLYEKSSKEIEWHINAQGMRSDTLLSSQPDHRYRIATYGDSETFGWSVDLQDTWQQRMQEKDPSIEVINLGVPGYNIASIASHMEKTLPAIQPDLIIYLFNKNDVYLPLNYHPIWSKSYLYLIVNMGLYQLKADQRKKWRKSEQGTAYFRTQLQHMISLCEDNNIPFLIAVQHWKYIYLFPESLQYEQSTSSDSASKSESYIRTINVERVVDHFPRRDAHLTEPAHAALADFLCLHLAGAENDCRLTHPYADSSND